MLTEQKMLDWMPHDNKNHIAKYDGHHDKHYHALLVWTDIYGDLILVGCTVLGSMQDCAIFNDNGPYCDSELFQSFSQNTLGHKGYAGIETHAIFRF